jgi:hypothetical protein
VQLHIGESLDSGFDASHRPGMAARKRSGGHRPDRLWLCLLPMAAQFGRYLDVQHLFQPDEAFAINAASVIW